jgi:cytidylate kinase
MNTPAEVERCLSFIHCQLQPPPRRDPGFDEGSPKRAVTLSRQCGCGAHVIANLLSRYLEAGSAPGAPPWTVYDRNLVETVLTEHHLPSRFSRFMPEDRVTEMNDIMAELLGLCPASWTFVQQTSETILRLIEKGNLIIVGRGANIIAANRPHVLNVRLIGSIERRVERKAEMESLDRKEALNRIRLEDAGRQRYILKHFNKDINDPSLYDFVLNTDWLPAEAAARIIGELVHSRNPAMAAA